VEGEQGEKGFKSPRGKKEGAKQARRHAPRKIIKGKTLEGNIPWLDQHRDGRKIHRGRMPGINREKPDTTIREKKKGGERKNVKWIGGKRRCNASTPKTPNGKTTKHKENLQFLRLSQKRSGPGKKKKNYQRRERERNWTWKKTASASIGKF